MLEATEADKLYLTAVPRLHQVAYRVLRDAGEAEHVVQEVWIRWHGVDHSTINQPVAFLTTATRRLALNYLSSARRRLEVCTAEPPERGGGLEPPAVADRTEHLDAIVSAMLWRLSPVELAVFVLREGFAYTHEQLADVLQTHPANTRQVLLRARRRMVGELRHHRRGSTNDDARRRLVAAISAAAHTGDLDGLEQVVSSFAEGSPIEAIKATEAA